MPADRTPSWPIPLVASGHGWLLVDKPAGMSVHNDPYGDVCALLSAFLRGGPNHLSDIGFDPGFGVHAVHRLDRDTSGLLMLGCRREVFEALSRAFAGGGVQKEYLALVHGLLPAGTEGVWDWPLSPSAAGRRDPQGPEPHRPSTTRYRSIQCGRCYTLLEVRPLTGRQHQIRRHAVLAGHAVLGDRRYGPPRACRYLAANHAFTRLALHAAALSLQPPEEDIARRFESPELPAAIRGLQDQDLEAKEM